MICSPDPASSRSRLADWIEVTAVVHRRAAGVADIAGLLRIDSEDDRDRIVLAPGDMVEEEIVESRSEELADRIANEIGFRRDALSDLYPFEVDPDPFKITLKKPDELKAEHKLYLFNLMMTAAKDGTIQGFKDIAKFVSDGRRLFHVCASIGVAGLLQEGHTFWFGFPRPDKTPFSTALEDLCKSMTVGSRHNPPPIGFPVAAKDDQIDIVGWRPFKDSMMGTQVVLCQAATGDNWDSKSVASHVSAFTDWFLRPPYGNAAPCLAIPFPLHHDVDEPAEGAFEEAVYNVAKRLSKQHGILVDRLRISIASRAAASDPESKKRIAGHDSFQAVQKWADDVVGLLVA